MRLTVYLTLAAWLALVVVLGANDALFRPRGTPPLPILVAAAGPVVAFLAAYVAVRSFRALVLGADLRLLTAIQSWRVVGFAFVVLTLHDLLPGSFAWSAGLGDIAVGLTAPWVMLALIRRPGFAAGTLFSAWNAFGILDLAVAVGLGAANNWFPAGEVTTGAMTRMPLVLIPAFFVPLFVMMHLTALLQAWYPRTSGWPASGGADRGSGIHSS